MRINKAQRHRIEQAGLDAYRAHEMLKIALVYAEDGATMTADVRVANALVALEDAAARIRAGYTKGLDRDLPARVILRAARRRLERAANPTTTPARRSRARKTVGETLAAAVVEGPKLPRKRTR